MTTAIYPNRLSDKKRLEAQMGLEEQGSEDIVFYYNQIEICRGYTRIVYGDHGPYIEFDRNHIRCFLVNKWGKPELHLPDEDKATFYYYWLTPKGQPDLKVYLQIKPVTDLPNAPRRADGFKSNFNRSEGYADYKRGFYYIDPYQLDAYSVSEIQ
mgnify:CR=1 FL=1